MYTPIASKSLKTGEPLEIGIAMPPDETYEPLIRPFLGHKPRNFQWHLSCAFEPDGIRGLETRFYLGLLDHKIICNIMTVEYEGIGILGHVFTAVEHRRKGACRLVMTEQMADFRRRGGRYMTLGTGYDSAPYWIYHSFGFRSIIPESGFMRFKTDDRFETTYFASGGTEITTPSWKDWPVLNALCAQTDMPYLRHVAFELYGAKSFEGGYLTFFQGIQEEIGHDARFLVSRTGAIAGYATIQPDKRWNGQVVLLDLFVHPNFTRYAHELLQTLPLPADRKIQCYTEADADWKIAPLLEEGFEHEASLREQLEHDGRLIDVEVYGKK